MITKRKRMVDIVESDIVFIYVLSLSLSFVKETPFILYIIYKHE